MDVSNEDLKFLVVEDDATSRMILVRGLARQGYQVVAAENGAVGVEKFEQERPDLVLMDVQMPVMDGLEATKAIKALAGETFVPVIFLTATTNDERLRACIECGGDDFITKPYSVVVLNAKVAALLRIRQLTEETRAQRDELGLHQMQLFKEQQVAETVFSRIVNRGTGECDSIKRLVSPMSVFNGDILLTAETPSGGIRVALGDFTGHGLVAAIGALPFCEAFYAMTSKGFSIKELVAEVNTKLRMVLPTGMFCACVVMEIDRYTNQLIVWSGGMCDVLLRGANGGIRRRIPSRHLALGVVGSGKLDTTLESYNLEPGERLLAYSDGVVESSNPAGEMYGEHRLEALFASPDRDVGRFFEDLSNELGDFTENLEQDDDITLVEVTAEELSTTSSDPASAAVARVHRTPVSWDWSLRIESDTIRQFDPLPMIMQAFHEIQGLHDHREKLYTVMAELYSNSLDHGLLGLDSVLKATSEGFARYYAERQKRLEDLQDGWISIVCSHRPSGEGGSLRMRVEDSGPGFDFERSTSSLEGNEGHSGRGMALVRTICDEVAYMGSGNIVEVTFNWERGAR